MKHYRPPSEEGKVDLDLSSMVELYRRLPRRDMQTLACTSRCWAYPLGLLHDAQTLEKMAEDVGTVSADVRASLEKFNPIWRLVDQPFHGSDRSVEALSHVMDWLPRRRDRESLSLSCWAGHMARIEAWRASHLAKTEHIARVPERVALGIFDELEFTPQYVKGYLDDFRALFSAFIRAAAGRGGWADRGGKLQGYIDRLYTALLPMLEQGAGPAASLMKAEVERARAEAREVAASISSPHLLGVGLSYRRAVHELSCPNLLEHSHRPRRPRLLTPLEVDYANAIKWRDVGERAGFGKAIRTIHEYSALLEEEQPQGKLQQIFYGVVRQLEKGVSIFKLFNGVLAPAKKAAYVALWRLHAKSKIGKGLDELREQALDTARPLFLSAIDHTRLRTLKDLNWAEIRAIEPHPRFALYQRRYVQMVDGLSEEVPKDERYSPRQRELRRLASSRPDREVLAYAPLDGMERPRSIEALLESLRAPCDDERHRPQRQQLDGLIRQEVRSKVEAFARRMATDEAECKLRQIWPQIEAESREVRGSWLAFQRVFQRLDQPHTLRAVARELDRAAEVAEKQLFNECLAGLTPVTVSRDTRANLLWTEFQRKQPGCTPRNLDDFWAKLNSLDLNGPVAVFRDALVHRLRGGEAAAAREVALAQLFAKMEEEPSEEVVLQGAWVAHFDGNVPGSWREVEESLSEAKGQEALLDRVREERKIFERDFLDRLFAEEPQPMTKRELQHRLAMLPVTYRKNLEEASGILYDLAFEVVYQQLLMIPYDRSGAEPFQRFYDRCFKEIYPACKKGDQVVPMKAVLDLINEIHQAGSEGPIGAIALAVDDFVQRLIQGELPEREPLRWILRTLTRHLESASEGS